MNEIIKKALNRGVPIDTPIDFDILEFLELFEKRNFMKNIELA